MTGLKAIITSPQYVTVIKIVPSYIYLAQCFIYIFISVSLKKLSLRLRGRYSFTFNIKIFLIVNNDLRGNRLGYRLVSLIYGRETRIPRGAP